MRSVPRAAQFLANGSAGDEVDFRYPVSGLPSLDVRVISPALAGVLQALAVGPGGVRGDSARPPATLNTSRRIALLPGRMKNQYAANNRRVLGSVAVTRVSVLSRVPAAVGSTRNSSQAAATAQRWWSLTSTRIK